MRLLLKERGKGVSGKTPTTPDIWAALPAEWGSASGTDLIGSIVNASAGDVKYSNHEKHKGKKNLMPTDYETCSGNNAKSFFPAAYNAFLFSQPRPLRASAQGLFRKETRQSFVSFFTLIIKTIHSFPNTSYVSRQCFPIGRGVPTHVAEPHFSSI